MIRVLIVEDSETTRMLLQSILSSDPEISVIGTAIHGADGLRQAHRLTPDLITMDIHMPLMDGYEATRRIMAECPTPIVLVSQSVDPGGPAAAFDAMQAGALTIVQTPPAPSHPDFAAACNVLLTTVKLMSQVKVIRRRVRKTDSPQAPQSADNAALQPETRPALFAIGSSTGGPAALNRILKALPADFPVPIVIVQHMSLGFSASLVHWLQQDCRLKMALAEERSRIQPGHVYIAPDDRHVLLRARGVLGLSDAAPVSFVRPSATVLFESAAVVYGSEVVGVLLTGMGDDGARGLLAIRLAHGITLAQDESTSVVYGMPKAAVALGSVTKQLPLERIAPALIALARAAP